MALEIVGHAVVSADGMIADRDHRMPVSLRNDEDWRRFQAALDAAALVVLGRIGHEAHPNPGRKRLVVTSRAAALAPDPADPNATLWNPGGLPFSEVAKALGIATGTIAVTGGQRVFDLFLPLFTGFDLVEIAGVTIPDGLLCFSGGPPKQMLVEAGLRAQPVEELDPGVTLTIWRRN